MIRCNSSGRRTDICRLLAPRAAVPLTGQADYSHATRLRRIAIAAAMLLFAVAAPSLAQPPTQEPPPPGKDQPRDATLDRGLLRRLAGDAPAPPEAEVDLLDRAVNNMRMAAARIESGKIGTPTRDLHEQILKDLDELIKQAMQSPPPSDSPPPPSSEEPSSDRNSAEQQRRQAEAESRPEEAPMPQETAESQTEQGASTEQAKDSADRLGQADAAQMEMVRRQQMIKDVWGHLPPAVRDKLLNVGSEKVLPGYEDLARKYFEALAEDDAKKEHDAAAERHPQACRPAAAVVAESCGLAPVVYGRCYRPSFSTSKTITKPSPCGVQSLNVCGFCSSQCVTATGP